jgi:hypothetical protein
VAVAFEKFSAQKAWTVSPECLDQWSRTISISLLVEVDVCSSRKVLMKVDLDILLIVDYQEWIIEQRLWPYPSSSLNIIMIIVINFIYNKRLVDMTRSGLLIICSYHHLKHYNSKGSVYVSILQEVSYPFPESID